MKKKLGLSAGSAIFAIAVLAVVGILTGSVDLGSGRVYDVGRVAVAGGLLALAGAALLGGRSAGDLELWEYVTVAVAVGVFVGTYADVLLVTDLLSQYHPWTGLVASAASYLGYHRLAWG